jgi:hypothetical protein
MKSNLRLVVALATILLAAPLVQAESVATPAPMVISQYALSDIVTFDHKAIPWEHVLVDLSAAGPNPSVIVALPPTAVDGDRIRVSEVSADGGVGCGGQVMIMGPGSSVVAGGTVLDGSNAYVIANDGFMASKRHAAIEVVWKMDGWLIVSETAKP